MSARKRDGLFRLLTQGVMRKRPRIEGPKKDAESHLLQTEAISGSLDMATGSDLNKNAVSAFMEYGYQRRCGEPVLTVVERFGPDHKPMFVVAACLGEREICRERGGTKDDAKRDAAERAMVLLRRQETKQTSSSPRGSVPESRKLSEYNPVPSKDPVAAFMEFAQAQMQVGDFHNKGKSGPDHMPQFTMVAALGERLFPSAVGKSAKEAKKISACVALNILKKEGRLQKVFSARDLARPIPLQTGSTGSPAVANKNAVAVLNEHAQQCGMTARFVLKSQTGLQHKPIFQIAAVLGDEEFRSIKASNKKEGNILAAEVALKELVKRGRIQLPVDNRDDSQGASEGRAVSHFDKVAALSHRKFDELLELLPEPLTGRKVMAAIIAVNKATRETEVVSLASGNRCVTGDLLTDDGTVVHDSHAEILARRAFRRFLYKKLMAPNRTGPEGYFEAGSGRKLRVKDDYTFHLYISTAPCGDGAVSSRSVGTENGDSEDPSAHRPIITNTQTQGLLRTKMEKGEGTIPIEDQCRGQTLDGIRNGERLRVMSCSDKVCRWNVVGLQGALLSNFLEPVYLTSVTLGMLYSHGHLSRALCCRVQRQNSASTLGLPAGYMLNHPRLGSVTNQSESRAVDKSREFSVNWCAVESDVEVTNGTTGRKVNSRANGDGSSRLCKKAFLGLFHRTCTTLKRSELLQVRSYRQLKDMDTGYRGAKRVFLQRMSRQGHRSWLGMPEEVDMFH